ncbi:MAG: arylsulfatase [Spirochaetaceae bacterium]
MAKFYIKLDNSINNNMVKIVLFIIMGLILPRIILAKEVNDTRPNIIFILSDDAGYGDFGKYGQDTILTPNIDKMADDGIMFTDHYAGAPVCAPSRSCLLTGKHTGHTDIRGNKEVQPEGQHPLTENTYTVAQMLQDEDIETAVFGKWGLGYPESSGTPEKQGFDEFYGYNCQRQAHNYYPDYIWENQNILELDGETYTHDLFTDKTLEYIEENRNNAFFLYLAYAIPHAALQVPDIEPYKDQPWPENMKKFAAMMTRMDSDIGQIIDKLEKLGIDENTLIMFSSDNGPHAEGGADPEFFNSSGPFRGIKRDLYEGGIRIPLIAKWPGTITPGQVSDHPSAFWDFMPTVADIYGIKKPDNIDGISYLPTLLGNKDEQETHDYLYWEFHENVGLQAVRKDDWKAVRKFVRLFPNGPIELYNLKTDPGEKINVADENSEIVKDMKLIMSSARTESEDFPLIGKSIFKPGLENGWLFLIPGMLISIFVFLLTKKNIKNDLFLLNSREKTFISLRLLTTMGLSLITVFSPLLAMSSWFATSVITAVISLIGFAISAGITIKRESGFTKYLLNPIYNNLPQIFLFAFWIALGTSVISIPYIISLSIWVVVRMIRR